MKATQRLYLTADRKTVVPAGHELAATLYCAPGDEIPESAVKKFGLVDGGLKEDRSGADKERKGGSDKGGNGSGAGTLQPDHPTNLKGVGAKTAEALAKAGLTTIAAIAAVDPASPPAVEGLSPTFDWAKVQKAAQDALPAGAEDRSGADKERKGGSDKGGNGSGAGTLQPDHPTNLKGVGAKTAEALAKAGLTTIAAIAAVDPASPPAVEGLSPTFDWAKVQKAAQDALPAGAGA